MSRLLSIMRFVLLHLAVGSFGVVMTMWAAKADPLDPTAVLRQLAPTQKPLVRSLNAPKESRTPTYLPGEKTFIRSIPTRGLTVEMKQEVGKIIDARMPPRIDIEITFDLDSDSIDSSSVPDLNALGLALLDPLLAKSRIILNGHTDAKGSREYNLALSQRRAESVRDFLLTRFPIDANQLVAIGFGEERLRNILDPEAAENRRVEVVNMGE